MSTEYQPVFGDAGEREPLLKLTEVSKIFKLEAGLFAAAGRHVWAVNEVSLDIYRGQTYGLVGESGSGKTTLARTIVQLVPHSAGTILYYPGKDNTRHGLPSPWEISHKHPQALRHFRSDVKYIFQDPSSALDPRLSVFEILTAGLKYNPSFDRQENVRRRAEEVMESVGLRIVDLDRRPAEFSGGQRQRISLARAILGKPAALICDEVVSALDVSIQGQILNLLIELKSRYDLTILFIAHDLTVVSYMADRVGVMYGGSLMEEAPAQELIRKPLHPYTQLLYNSVPQLGKQIQERSASLGTPYNPTTQPTGCPFAGRCPMAQEICKYDKPRLHNVRLPESEVSGDITVERGVQKDGDLLHKVACHFVD